MLTLFQCEIATFLQKIENPSICFFNVLHYVIYKYAHKEYLLNYGFDPILTEVNGKHPLIYILLSWSLHQNLRVKTF